MFFEQSANDFLLSLTCDGSCGLYYSYDKRDTMFGVHSDKCRQLKKNMLEKEFLEIDERCKVKSSYTFVSNTIKDYNSMFVGFKKENAKPEFVNKKFKKHSKKTHKKIMPEQIKNLRILDSLKYKSFDKDEILVKKVMKKKEHNANKLTNSRKTEDLVSTAESEKDQARANPNVSKIYGPFVFHSDLSQNKAKGTQRKRFEKKTFEGESVREKNALLKAYIRELKTFNTRKTLIKNGRKVFWESSVNCPLVSLEQRAKASNIGLVGIETNPGPVSSILRDIKMPFLNELDPYLEDWRDIGTKTLSSQQLRAHLGDARFKTYEEDLNFVFGPISDVLTSEDKTEEEINSIKSKISLEIRKVSFKFQRPSLEKLVLELKDHKLEMYRSMKKIRSIAERANFLMHCVDKFADDLKIYISDEERIDFYCFSVYEFFTDYITTMPLDEIEKNLFNPAIVTLPSFLSKVILKHMKSEIKEIRIRTQTELEIRYDKSLIEQRLMYFTRLSIQDAVKRTLKNETVVDDVSSIMSTANFSEFDFEDHVNDIDYDSDKLLYNPAYLNKNSFQSLIGSNLIDVESFPRVLQAVNNFLEWYESEVNIISETISYNLRISMIESVWFSSIRKIASELPSNTTVEECLAISVLIGRKKILHSDKYEFSFIKGLIDMIPEDCYIPESRQLELKRVFKHSLDHGSALSHSYEIMVNSLEGAEITEEETLETVDFITDPNEVFTVEDIEDMKLASDEDFIQKLTNKELSSVYKLLKSSLIRKIKDEKFIDKSRLTLTFILFIVDVSTGGSVTTATSLVALCMLVMKVLCRNELVVPSENSKNNFMRYMSLVGAEKVLKYNEIAKLVIQLSSGDFVSAIITSGSIIWSMRNLVKDLNSLYTPMMEHLTRFSKKFRSKTFRRRLIKDNFRILKRDLTPNLTLNNMPYDILFYVFDFMNKSELVAVSRVSYYLNESFKIYLPSRFVVKKLPEHNLNVVISQIKHNTRPISIETYVHQFSSEIEEELKKHEPLKIEIRNLKSKLDHNSDDFYGKIEDLMRQYHETRKITEKFIPNVFAASFILKSINNSEKYNLETFTEFINKSIFFIEISELSRQTFEKEFVLPHAEIRPLPTLNSDMKADLKNIKPSQKRLLDSLDKAYSAHSGSLTEDKTESEKEMIQAEAPPQNLDPAQFGYTFEYSDYSDDPNEVDDAVKAVENKDLIIETGEQKPINQFSFGSDYEYSDDGLFPEKELVVEDVIIKEEFKHLYRPDLDFKLTYNNEIAKDYTKKMLVNNRVRPEPSVINHSDDCCEFLSISSANNLCAVYLVQTLLSIAGDDRTIEELHKVFKERSVELNETLKELTSEFLFNEEEFYDAEVLIAVLDKLGFYNYEISYSHISHTDKGFSILGMNAHYDLVVSKEYCHNMRCMMESNMNAVLAEIQLEKMMTLDFIKDDFERPEIQFEVDSDDGLSIPELPDSYKEEKDDSEFVKVEIIEIENVDFFLDFRKKIKYELQLQFEETHKDSINIFNEMKKIIYGIEVPHIRPQGRCYEMLEDKWSSKDVVYYYIDDCDENKNHVSMYFFDGSTSITRSCFERLLKPFHSFYSWFEDARGTPSSLNEINSEFGKKNFSVEDFELHLINSKASDYEGLYNELRDMKNLNYDFSFYSTIASKWLDVYSAVKGHDFSESLIEYLHSLEEFKTRTSYDTEVSVALIIFKLLNEPEWVEIISPFVVNQEAQLSTPKVLLDTNVFIRNISPMSISNEFLLVVPKTIPNELMRLYVEDKSFHTAIETFIMFLKRFEFVLVPDVSGQGDDELLKLDDGEIFLCSFDLNFRRRWLGPIYNPETNKYSFQNRSQSLSYSFQSQFGNDLIFDGNFKSTYTNEFLGSDTIESQDDVLPLFNNIDEQRKVELMRVDSELRDFYLESKETSFINELKSKFVREIVNESDLNSVFKYICESEKEFKYYNDLINWREIVENEIKKTHLGTYSKILKSAEVNSNHIKKNAKIKIDNNVEYTYPVNSLSIVKGEQDSNSHLLQFKKDSKRIFYPVRFSKRKVLKPFHRHFLNTDIEQLKERYKRKNYDESSNYDLKVCDLNLNDNWDISLQEEELEYDLDSIFSNLKSNLIKFINVDKGLERFCRLHNHLVYDSIHNYKITDLYVNHNNFFNMGYILYSGSPARSISSKRQFRYFFIVKEKDMSRVKTFFKPYFESDKDDDENVFIVSNLVTIDIETIVWRSNLFLNTIPLLLLPKEIDQYYNVYKYIWCLFNPSKTIRKLSSFFKYYNIISASTINKRQNLVKKYLSVKIKRKSEVWLLNRIINVLESIQDGVITDVFGISSNFDEFLNINNFYSFPRSRTTNSHHNYNEFLTDILSNFEVKNSHVDPILISNNISDLKHVNFGLLNESIQHYKTDIYKGYNEISFVDTLKDDFDSFFSTTTNGCDPFTMKKKKNLIIHRNVLSHYVLDSNEKKFSVINFLNWGLKIAKNRGCFSFVSEKIQKDAADREIYVQDYFCKLAHFPIQTIYKKLCSDWPEELVSKSEKYKLNMISKMPFTDTSFYINLDMKKWSPQDIREKFPLTTQLLYDEGIFPRSIYELLMICHSLTSNIVLLFDERVKHNFSIKEYFKLNDMNDIKFKHSKDFILKSDIFSSSLSSSKFAEIKMEFGWPQGLNHFVSTFFHGLASIACKKYIPKIINKPLTIYYTFHSDDGNMAVVPETEFSLNQKREFLIASQVILLNFSLSMSDTKISLTDGKNPINLKPSSFKEGHSELVSELVSVYNKEGTIINPWLRQSANIYSTLVSQDYKENYLDLLSRCVNIFNNSNNIRIPEAILSFINKRLRARHDNFNNHVIPVQAGGCLTSPVFKVSKYGFYYDNVVKILSGVNVEKFFYNKIKVNSMIDSKTKREIALDNLIIRDMINTNSKNDLLSVMIGRTESINSGLLIPKFSLDLFSTFVKNQGKIYSFSLFGEDLDDEEERVKIDLHQYNEIVSKYEDKTPTELTLGSEIIAKEIIKDVNSFKDCQIELKNSELIGSIVSNEIRGVRDISNEFDEVINFVENNNEYKNNEVLLKKYNQLNIDYLTFTSKFKIRTMSQLKSSKDLWNLEKRASQRSGFSMLYKSGKVYDDMIFKTESKIEIFEHKDIRMEFNRMKFKPIKKTRSNLLRGTISSVINRFLLSMTSFDELKKELNRVINSFSIKDLSDYMQMNIPVQDRVLVSYFGKLEVSIRNKCIYIHTEDEEDTSFVVVDVDNVRSTFICKEDTLYAPEEIDEKIRSMIRRDVRFVKKIKYDEGYEIEKIRRSSEVEFPEGFVVSIDWRPVYRNQKEVGKNLCYTIIGEKKFEKRTRLALTKVERKNCLPDYYVNTDNYIITLRRSNADIHINETRNLRTIVTDFRPHLPNVIRESKVDLRRISISIMDQMRQFIEFEPCSNHEYRACEFETNKRDEPSFCLMTSRMNKTSYIKMKNSKQYLEYKSYFQGTIEKEEISRINSEIESKINFIRDQNDKKDKHMKNNLSWKDYYNCLDEYATLTLSYDNVTCNIFRMLDIVKENYDTSAMEGLRDKYGATFRIAYDEKRSFFYDLYEQADMESRMRLYSNDVKMVYGALEDNVLELLTNSNLKKFTMEKSLAKYESPQFQLYLSIKESGMRVTSKKEVNRLFKEIQRIYPRIPGDTFEEKKKAISDHYLSSGIWSRSFSVDDFWQHIKEEQKFIFIDTTNRFIAIATPTDFVRNPFTTISDIIEPILPKRLDEDNFVIFGKIGKDFFERMADIAKSTRLLREAQSSEVENNELRLDPIEFSYLNLENETRKVLEKPLEISAFINENQSYNDYMIKDLIISESSLKTNKNKIRPVNIELKPTLKQIIVGEKDDYVRFSLFLIRDLDLERNQIDLYFRNLKDYGRPPPMMEVKPSIDQDYTFVTGYRRLQDLSYISLIETADFHMNFDKKGIIDAVNKIIKPTKLFSIPEKNSATIALYHIPRSKINLYQAIVEISKNESEFNKLILGERDL